MEQGVANSRASAEKKTLTREAFKQLTQLAGLALRDQDLEALAPRASQLLQSIALLEELDLEDVEPIFLVDILKGE